MGIFPFYGQICVNYGTKTPGGFEERSYNRHFNAYCQRTRNNVTKSPLSKCKRAINSRSSFLQLYLCLYLKSKISHSRLGRGRYGYDIMTLCHIRCLPIPKIISINGRNRPKSDVFLNTIWILEHCCLLKGSSTTEWPYKKLYTFPTLAFATFSVVN